METFRETDNFRDRHTTDMGSYQYNIDRRLMERDNFNQQSYGPEGNRDGDSQWLEREQNYGEITGEFLNGFDLDKGMPMRTGMVQHPAEREEYSNLDNPYLDFNLYKERPQMRVSNHDPFAMQGAGDISFSKLDDNTQILRQPVNSTQQ